MKIKIFQVNKYWGQYLVNLLILHVAVKKQSSGFYI